MVKYQFLSVNEKCEKGLFRLLFFMMLLRDVIWQLAVEDQ
jgi:hypothetical protein